MERIIVEKSILDKPQVIYELRKTTVALATTVLDKWRQITKKQQKTSVTLKLHFTKKSATLVVIQITSIKLGNRGEKFFKSWTNPV